MWIYLLFWGWIGSSLGLVSRLIPPSQIILHIYADKKGPETVGWDLLSGWGYGVLWGVPKHVHSTGLAGASTSSFQQLHDQTLDLFLIHFFFKNLYVYKHSALRSQCPWRLLDFLEWKLQLLTIIWVIGIELEYFGRRVSVPNCWAVSPIPCISKLKEARFL